MNKEVHAIVLVYRGDAPTDETIGQIVETLVNSGATIPELVTATYKDQNGISTALVNAAKAPKDPQPDKVCQAAMYIGKRFEKELADPLNNVISFAMAITNAMSNIRMKFCYNTVLDKQEKALLNAVGIISENANLIPANYKTVYNLSDDIIRIIVETGKL